MGLFSFQIILGRRFSVRLSEMCRSTELIDLELKEQLAFFLCSATRWFNMNNVMDRYRFFHKICSSGTFNVRMHVPQHLTRTLLIRRPSLLGSNAAIFEVEQISL